MKHYFASVRRVVWLLSPMGLLLLTGCDEGGVLDIIAGSLQLAFGIVNAAS